MITEAQVRERIDNVFQPIAPYITQLVGIFATSEEFETYLLAVIINEASYHAKPAGTALAYREALIVSADGWGMATAPVVLLARNLPPPPTVVNAHPQLPPPPPVYDAREEKARLLRNRTPKSRSRGNRLAGAAQAMNGWFHWVKSGPKTPGFVGHFGVDYMPKTGWNRTATDLGVDDHDLIVNDFARWLVVPHAPAPGIGSHMNCWEAVLSSACRAGLVDKLTLTTIHRRAALHYQISNESVSYFKTLSQAFNFAESVPFLPEAGLIPQPGDILFWSRDEHVGVSLGRTWAGGHPTDLCMSLWLHNNKTFARLTLEDMPPHMRGDLKFIPCPF